MTFIKHDFDRTTFFEDKSITQGLSDDLLLDLVQNRTLNYFKDYSCFYSGMVQERSNASPAYDYKITVTTGGTGFGIMAMIAGVERGWMPYGDFDKQLTHIVSFLNKAESFHGVFPHFLNGMTGKAIAFSKKDDGGDLVETSFLMMGLLSARDYIGDKNPALVNQINDLWRKVEWDHHIRPKKKDLLWHWSPKYGYQMGHRLEGWNECLLTYVLATASPDHSISPDLYHDVWAKGKEFRNGQKYYGHELQLGPQFGGPLFLSQYSFLGINPKGLSDQYADYWEQNRTHSLINYEHCRQNPYAFRGYGSECWGLTASDSVSYEGYDSYRAHAPSNDYGVISPTAALSSFPYTPVQSMQALRHFYEDRGEKIFGRHGFVDAFQSATEWTSQSHLAIDQGPIVVMIENFRSGLLWKIGMNMPEIKKGLSMLGFKMPDLSIKPAPVAAPA